MKRLLLLLLLAVGMTFISCSENSTSDSNGTNEIMFQLGKKFDFSEVDTDGLVVYNIFEGDNNNIDPLYFRYPETTIMEGYIDNHLWIGVFETPTGKLKYQYTDYDQPILYETGKSEMYGIYFEDDILKNIAIRYPQNKPNTFYLDLITIEPDKIYRHTVNENALCDPLHISNHLARWVDGMLCMYYVQNLIIFDIYNHCFKCHISQYDNTLDSYASSSIFWAKADLLSTPTLFITQNNLLHCFYVNIVFGTCTIREYELAFDIGTLVKEQRINIYNDIDYARDYYYLEYKSRTDDHFSAVVTQTKYDGTVTTKAVNVRLENDELKVEIQ